jgi:two-component system, cell cycle sensor histidine kinase and response regulator CckA
VTADGGRGTGTILVVDDEPLLRVSTERILQSAGYETVGAESASIALAILRDSRSHFDLVITDVVMPGMSGLDLARDVTQLMPMLPVLLMSGYAHDQLEREGRPLPGRVELVKKPLPPDRLVATVARVLAGATAGDG